MYRVESYESTASGISASSTELAAIHESKEAFESVTSVEELQRLTIAFLRGEISATSYHFGPLLSESTPLVEKLVKLNELGFITTGSQPGGADTYNGRVDRRFFVEGILKRRHLALFLREMYKLCGSACFIALPETERTYEEIQDLEAADLYWVARRHGHRGTGLLHVTEATGPCQAFSACEDIYPQLVDEYVSIFVIDTRWGYHTTAVLDAAIQSLQTIHQLATQNAQRNISQ